MDVVEVDDAVSWYAVSIGPQSELGYEPAASARECCDNDGPDSLSDWITREHQYGTISARCRCESI